MLKLLIVAILSLFICSHSFVIQPRIIDGIVSNPEDFKFFVFVEDGENTCGAALLNNRWIVTAAHCLVKNIEINVHFGISEKGDFNTIQRVPTTNQYIHAWYLHAAHKYDIGLIEIPSPLTLNEHIAPVKLPSVCNVAHPGDESVIAIGTGRTEMDEPAWDRRLRQAPFTTMSMTACKKYFPVAINMFSIICIDEDRLEHRATFNGDSGGPLIRQKDGALIGIASFGRHTASAVKYQVFTNIQYYYEWLTRKTGIILPKCEGPQASG